MKKHLLKKPLPEIVEILGLVLQINLQHRVPEEHETVDGEEADDYIGGCDFPENSDYPITAAEIEHHAGSMKGKTILEIGQGPGNLMEALLERGAAKVIGLDSSERMTEHCSEKFAAEVKQGRMQFIQGSIYHSQLPKELVESVDMVVSENTWHQLYNPQEALRGMVCALVPGGSGFIRDFRRDGVSKRMLFDRAMYTKTVIVPYVLASIGAALTKDEFTEMLQRIPGIRYEVRNAINPITHFPDLAEVIAQDPVPHWRDFVLSQVVVLTKTNNYQ